MTQSVTPHAETARPRGRLSAVGWTPGAGVLVRRFNVLFIALALGAALVVSAVQNYADARRAGDTFAEKQGIALFRSLGLQPSQPRAALHERLERAIAAPGVWYLAHWQDSALALELGHDAFPDLPLTPGEIQVRGGLARMCFSNRLLPRLVPAPPIEVSAPVEGGEAVVVMQFEPIGNMDFAARALLSLWLSSGAALLLMSAAVVVWRLGERAGRMQLELSQQRHLATLGSLSAVLAHELKNPLTALKGNAQLLAENALNERARAQSERVVDSVARLEAVIDDLLEFSRSGAIRPVPSSPWHVLSTAIEATHPQRIDAVALHAPPSWVLDANRMQQVLVNLLDNASQVTPDGARIGATVSQQGHELEYTVEDGGPGIPLQERDKIFEPFYTTRLRGTGLGLAIAKRIVELHGGRIDVEAREGGGALFRIRIPRLHERGPES